MQAALLFHGLIGKISIAEHAAVVGQTCIPSENHGDL
jgi:hypothetical protein